MSMRSPLRALLAAGAIVGFVGSAWAVPLNYQVVVAESDINTTMSAAATVDINPDLLNQFPQFGTLTGTSTTKPTSSSHAVADVGLPGSFNNGAGGITFSQLTFTTLLAPGVMDGFGAISVPGGIQLIAYTAKVASLSITLDAPFSSSLTPIGAGEWAWAGVANVTISGIIAPTVTIPTVQEVALGPYPFSQAITMPLAGTFSGDGTGTRVTLGIPVDALHNQSLTLPAIAVPVDLGGLVPGVGGVFSLSGLVLTDLTAAVVYSNSTPIPEPNTAALLALGLIGIALRRRKS
jgi:PEP-CTERM motif